MWPVQVGKVYYISRCQLKPANKKFSNLNNDYEMTFSGETQVVPCSEEDDSIPKIKFNFVPLQSLAETPADTIVGEIEYLTCNRIPLLFTLFITPLNVPVFRLVWLFCSYKNLVDCSAYVNIHIWAS